MFLKPANSDKDNGMIKIHKCPLKQIIYSEYWKQKKTLFERYQNNSAIWVDYLT